ANVSRYRRNKSGRWDRGRIIYRASSPIQFIAYSSTYDRTVAVDNQQLIVFTSKTNRKALPKARLGKISGKIHQLALTASERVAVTIGSDGAELWDVASTTRTALAHVDSGSNWESSVLSFDNDRVVSGVPNRDLRIWDLPPKSRGSQLLSDHSGGLLALQPSATGFTTASIEHGTQTTLVVRAHTNDGFEDNRQTYNLEYPPNVLALNPDGKIVAASSQDGIQIWRTDRSEEPEKTLPFHGAGAVKFLTFAGPSMLVAASDRDIVTWDFSEGRFKPKRWPTTKGRIRSLVATGEHLAIGIQTSPGQNGQVKVWRTNHPQDTQLRFKTDAPVNQVMFSKDGRWLASGTTDGRLYTQSMDGAQKNSYPLGAAITAIDISSAKDNSKVVAGARDGTIAIIPGAEDMSKVPRSTGIHEPVIGVAFGRSPDVIVAAYQGGDVVKWYAREAAWTSVPLGKHGSKLATLVAPRGGDIVLTLSSPESEVSTLQVWPVSPHSLWRHACEATGKICETYDWRPRRR
ncbi:MAG: WD40 repeat domain-containing protein, partial [Nannocystaceae bacterium]